MSSEWVAAIATLWAAFATTWAAVATTKAVAAGNKYPGDGLFATRATSPARMAARSAFLTARPGAYGPPCACRFSYLAIPRKSLWPHRGAKAAQRAALSVYFRVTGSGGNRGWPA